MGETKIKKQSKIVEADVEDAKVVDETPKPDFGDEYTTKVSTKNINDISGKEFDLGLLNAKQRRILKRKIGMPRYSDKNFRQEEQIQIGKLAEEIITDKSLSDIEKVKLFQKKRRNIRRSKKKKRCSYEQRSLILSSFS